MKDQHQIRGSYIGIVATVCTLAAAVGGGIALWTNLQSLPIKTSEGSKTITVPSTQEPPAQTPPAPPATVESPNSQIFPSSVKPESQEVKEKTVDIYWVKDEEGELQLTASATTFKTTDKPEAIFKAAFDRLLTGPENYDVFSAIPTGTKVQALTVENNGVYIDLSEEFTSGGGSASMINRLGQVIYTASSLEPDVKVWIFVGGKPLKMLGGEGLEVSQPMTRQNFQQEFQF